MNSIQYPSENVMVIPVQYLSDFLNTVEIHQKLFFSVDKISSTLNDPSKVQFLSRNSVENDINYIQIIPYVLLHHENRLLSYRRGKLLSEERLYNFYSLGVGGHITQIDQNLFSETYIEGMLREVNEEVSINTEYSVSPVIAVIYDDTNYVGKLHLGLIFIFNLGSEDVQAKEKSINEIRFIDIENLKNDMKSYESWSKICIEHIDDILQHIC